MNISKKLTLSFFSTVFLPIVIISSILILQIRDQAVEDFDTTTSREVKQVDNAIQILFSQIEQNLNFIAREPLINQTVPLARSYLSNPEGTQMDSLSESQEEAAIQGEGEIVRADAYYWAADDAVIVSTIKALPK